MRKVKAPGEDGADNRLIKEASIEFLAKLADLMTISLHVGYFPKPWTSALVSVIPKPNKDPHLPANYRPISLLSTLGKLQAGFRRERSTTDNILRLAEDIQRGFNKNEGGMVEGLVYRLVDHNLKLPKQMVALLNREIGVRVGASVSAQKPACPRAQPFSPLLLYISAIYYPPRG